MNFFQKMKVNLQLRLDEPHEEIFVLAFAVARALERLLVIMDDFCASKMKHNSCNI